MNEAMAENETRLPLRLCIGWGVGTLGISVMFNTLNVLMQRFVTDYLGVLAVTWGAIYLGAKIYDAVTDPVMGIISDRTRSRWGRRRPYLLVGGPPCGGGFLGPVSRSRDNHKQPSRLVAELC